MRRIETRLDDQTEGCIAEVIDAGMAVHRALGPGFLEGAYHNAMRIELKTRGLPFVREQSISISYRGEIVGLHRLDFVVRERVLIELKTVKALEPVHTAQIMAYLKASGLRVGLLMNFARPTLKEGLRRIVL